MISDSLLVLSTVLVTAHPVSPMPVQKMDTTVIEALSTSSVADALKYFAGVQIRDYGGLGGQKTVNVRSLGTQHTGVYIDGVRITNCQNGTVDLSKYSLENMESVELYNANKLSSLMSASEYASGATVYMTTRRPTKTEASVKGSAGSFGTYKANVHASYKSYVFADVEYATSKGNYPFEYHSQYEDTTGVRSNSGINYFRAEVGAFTSKFRSHLYVYNSHRGLPGGIVKRLSDKYGDVGCERDFNAFAQASYTDSVGQVSYRVNTRYSYDRLQANTCYIQNQFVRYNNTYIQQDLYASAAAAYRGQLADAPIQLSLSGDVRLSDLSTDVTGLSYIWRQDTKASVDLQYTPGSWRLSVAGLYTDIRDHSSLKVSDPLYRWCGYVNASWSGNGHQFRAFYKEVFRAPTLNDLYYTHVGNRALKPEFTKQFNIGYTYVNSWFNVQADAYSNRVLDKIICIPQGGAYDWKTMNRGKVSTIGLDLSSRVKIDNLMLFGTLTLQDVRDVTDKDNESEYFHKLMYSPTESFTLVASYEYKGWLASLSHMHVGERYWSFVEDDKLPSYESTDAKIQFSSKHYVVSFECMNIFDQPAELIQRWPLPMRRFNATIKIKI